MIKIEQRVPVELLNCFARPEDRLAKAKALPEVADEHLVQDNSGWSTSLLISSRMTPFSFSMSSSRNSGFNTRSASTSRAMGRCSSRTLVLKLDQFLTGEGVQTAANGIDRSRNVFGDCDFRSL